jgi:hypothetical protein
MSDYPALLNAVLKILLPFTRTYVCEIGFSVGLQIKNKYKNRLDVRNYYRNSLTTAVPRIKNCNRKPSKTFSFFEYLRVVNA